MPYKTFNKINEEREKDGLDLFRNPRNAAAGTIRQLNSSIVAKRNLDLFCYSIIEPEKYNLKTQSEVLNYLKELGFKVNPHFVLVSSIDEAKVANIDFDGSVFYFPDVANKKIYTKSMNMDGTVTINLYELKNT